MKSHAPLHSVLFRAACPILLLPSLLAANHDYHVVDRGVMIDLGGIAGEYSSSRGISNRGQVVGKCQVTVGFLTPFHACLWENGVSTLNSTDIVNRLEKNPPAIS